MATKKQEQIERGVKQRESRVERLQRELAEAQAAANERKIKQYEVKKQELEAAQAQAAKWHKRVITLIDEIQEIEHLLGLDLESPAEAETNESDKLESDVTGLDKLDNLKFVQVG